MKNWNTAPDEKLYHSIHLDGFGCHEDPITATYGLDYKSSNNAHNGKDPEYAPEAFNIKHIPNNMKKHIKTFGSASNQMNSLQLG